jgi:hypothetical protein
MTLRLVLWWALAVVLGILSIPFICWGLNSVGWAICSFCL